MARRAAGPSSFGGATVDAEYGEALRAMDLAWEQNENVRVLTASEMPHDFVPVARTTTYKLSRLSGPCISSDPLKKTGR